MLSIECCTEISLPLRDGGAGEGSGYTLAPCWVLTAHHVLFGDDVDEDKGTKITIVWRQAPSNAEGERPFVEVKRKHIVWADADLDLALIRCRLPDWGVSPPPAETLIARHIPANRVSRWESYGFLSEYADGQERRDAHNPSGVLGRVNPREPGDSIQVTEGAMDDEKAWAGFSGSPVFCEGKLLAVVAEANPGRRGASLRAVFLPHALDVVAAPQQRSLAALLDIDLNGEFAAALHAWFTKLFVRRLEQLDSVLVKQEAIAAFNQLNPDAGVANPKQLASALLGSAPGQMDSCPARVESWVWQHSAMDEPDLLSTALKSEAVPGRRLNLAADAGRRLPALKAVKAWSSHLPYEFWLETVLDIVDNGWASEVIDPKEQRDAKRLLNHLVHRVTAPGTDSLSPWARAWMMGFVARLGEQIGTLDDTKDAVWHLRSAVERWRRGLPPSRERSARHYWLRQQGEMLSFWPEGGAASQTGSLIARLASIDTRLEVKAERFAPVWPRNRPPGWADRWGRDDIGPWAEFVYQQVRQRLRWIPPGRFVMGSPVDEPGPPGRRGSAASSRVGRRFLVVRHPGHPGSLAGCDG